MKNKFKDFIRINFSGVESIDAMDFVAMCNGLTSLTDHYNKARKTNLDCIMRQMERDGDGVAIDFWLKDKDKKKPSRDGLIDFWKGLGGVAEKTSEVSKLPDDERKKWLKENMWWNNLFRSIHKIAEPKIKVWGEAKMFLYLNGMKGGLSL